MSLTADQTVEALRAAGEPTRLRVLSLLAGEELSVMELSGILDQSQPRVSRHLKLMTDAGLIERFPDGARVFYRLSSDPRARRLIDTVLDLLDATANGDDHRRLEDVRRTREVAASAYFERVAPQWDRIRSLYVCETAVEAAIQRAAGDGPFERVVDLGTGSGRMLTLLGRAARMSVGLDLSHNMLNIARANVSRAGLEKVELRHGDIFATRLPEHSADLVLVHQVLHYLADPAAAVAEAARLVMPGGRLLIVDFAPHQLEHLRAEHQHRRLGFSDPEMQRWLSGAGLRPAPPITLPPDTDGLTVSIWTAERPDVTKAKVA
ncbi:metalloregulator ArsR/SmtB family transcription factor [Brevundimonas sp.]|uniref:ArsR/SmtB family transcription factor n=1 Tax=Brevundimonas sp. TaxID=1871086 RepID=UPI002737ECBD|nr:metalloregulator ArsR/SmtB family transcription factor [Brevundimonas sp.]MDP3802496.1 metalloregulator ArsR/SmtB family transcription factor [Brevundimonas sp.]